MKKYMALILSVMLAVSFTACSSGNDNASTTEEETTERITSTTSPIKEDSEAGEELSQAIMSYFSDNENASVSGDTQNGSFVFSGLYDSHYMYYEEKSEELEQLGKENADAFVEYIGSYYTDEITYESIEYQEIGGSATDTGLDSCLYFFIYTNTQNQELKIMCDSRGVINYIICTFTW